jgi:hypothetical protein
MRSASSPMPSRRWLARRSGARRPRGALRLPGLAAEPRPPPPDPAQMARTQKNKATMGHLGMLKVGEGLGAPLAAESCWTGASLQV